MHSAILRNMNYELEIQKSFPVVTNTFTGTSPPLVAGTGSASLLSTTPTTVAWGAWTQLREATPFTVELWYLPVVVTGETIIAGHLTDGLIFDGTDLILRIMYSDGATLESRWTPDQFQSMHIALVYDTFHFVVYVNGTQVISLDADLTSTWSTTQTVLSLNRSLAGAGSGVYDALALYYRALSSNDILAHYAWGKTVPSAQEVYSTKGATTYTLEYADVDIFDSIQFDLSAGYGANVAYGTSLVALDASGGDWQAAIPLLPLAGTTTAGVHLTYEGYGVVLSYSLDGTTWTTTQNKRTILEGASSPDTLYIKIHLSNASSWLSSLRADILNSRSMQPISGSRVLNFAGTAMDQTPSHQLDYQADQGAQISNGYIDILADPNTTPANAAQVSAWIKFSGTDGWIMATSGTQFVSLAGGNISATGITMYRNGQPLANGQPAPVNQWNHYTFILGTPTNSTIRFGDKLTGGSALAMSLGSLGVYTTAMTAAQILAAYGLQVGSPGTQVSDSGVIGVTEGTPAVDIYAYAWSIVSGGV